MRWPGQRALPAALALEVAMQTTALQPERRGAMACGAAARRGLRIGLPPGSLGRPPEICTWPETLLGGMQILPVYCEPNVATVTGQAPKLANQLTGAPPGAETGERGGAP